MTQTCCVGSYLLLSQTDVTTITIIYSQTRVSGHLD